MYTCEPHGTSSNHEPPKLLSPPSPASRLALPKIPEIYSLSPGKPPSSGIQVPRSSTHYKEDSWRASNVFKPFSLHSTASFLVSGYVSNTERSHFTGMASAGGTATGVVTLVESFLHSIWNVRFAKPFEHGYEDCELRLHLAALKISRWAQAWQLPLASSNDLNDPVQALPSEIFDQAEAERLLRDILLSFTKVKKHCHTDGHITSTSHSNGLELHDPNNSASATQELCKYIQSYIYKGRLPQVPGGMTRWIIRTRQEFKTLIKRITRKTELLFQKIKPATHLLQEQYREFMNSISHPHHLKLLSDASSRGIDKQLNNELQIKTIVVPGHQFRSIIAEEGTLHCGNFNSIGSKHQSDSSNRHSPNFIKQSTHTFELIQTRNATVHCGDGN